MPSIEETFTLDHFWETSTKQAISQKVFFLCPEKKLSNTVESIYILCLLEVTRKKWYCKQYFRLPPNNNVPIMLCASWMSSRRTDPQFPPAIWFFKRTDHVPSLSSISSNPVFAFDLKISTLRWQSTLKNVNKQTVLVKITKPWANDIFKYIEKRQNQIFNLLDSFTWYKKAKAKQF